MNNTYFAAYKRRHDNFLRALLERTSIPAPRLKEAMLYALFPGGKRLRPLLVYLCGKALSIPFDILDLLAASVELMHTYSLVHDDLPAMDNDDMRRGKASCHKAFDEATAILAGDALQTLSVTILVEDLPQILSLVQVLPIIKSFVKACGASGMISGQIFDLMELTNPFITEDKLRTIHSLKTGQLISACITMVILASDAAKDLTKNLQDYGDLLGLIFQMQDDYLDNYAATALGKSHSSDLANQKFTFASIYQKEDLFAVLKTLFQQAKAILSPLGERANDLLQLTTFLEQRIKVTL